MFLPLIAVVGTAIAAWYGGFFDKQPSTTSAADTPNTPVTDTPKTTDILEKAEHEIVGSKEKYVTYSQLGLRTSSGVKVEMDADKKTPIISITGRGKISFDKEVTALIKATDSKGTNLTADAKAQKYSSGYSYDFNSDWKDDHVLKILGADKPIFGNDFSVPVA